MEIAHMNMKEKMNGYLFIGCEYLHISHMLQNGDFLHTHLRQLLHPTANSQQDWPAFVDDNYTAIYVCTEKQCIQYEVSTQNPRNFQDKLKLTGCPHQFPYLSRCIH
eukprot:3605522-Ditylum_brightwellii.AAC.1